VGELIGLALFFLVLYGFVRGMARILAALTGSRFRAYRLLASRYRGRYENRGMIDPPTVSFTHRGSSVRVGLAPVVPGQPAPPRTRVVARFGAAGLPFRFELMPAARPAPPQPPKGTRPVPSGLPAFDRAFAARANDAEIARLFLQSESVRTAVEGLRRLAPPVGMLVSVNPERLLVQVDRNLGQSPAQLDQAVRDALVLHDALVESAGAVVHNGVEIVDGDGPPDPALAAPPGCEVCGDPIEGAHVACTRCDTPYHRDCWSFVGGCSTFGCSGRQCRPAGEGT
jgi:hypothetical protein